MHHDCHPVIMALAGRADAAGPMTPARTIALSHVELMRAEAPAAAALGIAEQRNSRIEMDRQ